MNKEICFPGEIARDCTQSDAKKTKTRARPASAPAAPSAPGSPTTSVRPSSLSATAAPHESPAAVPAMGDPSGTHADATNAMAELRGATVFPARVLSGVGPGGARAFFQEVSMVSVTVCPVLLVAPP